MTTNATILFSLSDGKLQNFVTNSKEQFIVIPGEEEYMVIVKEVTEKEQFLDNVRMIAGEISRELKKYDIQNANIDQAQLKNTFASLDWNKTLLAFLEGWHLGAYSFDKYKSDKNEGIVHLSIHGDDNVDEIVATAKTRTGATMFSRNLVNEAPSALNPDNLPDVIKNELADTDVKVIVHRRKQLEEMQMNGILAVNRGSEHEPALIELHYEGDPSKPLVALVGKGVTFDTGGVSLKTLKDISDMRMDMSGAAAVAGAVKLLAASKAKVNVVAIIPTVENILDRHSLLPGDVIEYKTGQSVQIGNTDAEGRLILADALIRAGELKAEYIVNIATLTGAIEVALGPKIGGVFGDEENATLLKHIGSENGEYVWPLPLIDDYDETFANEYADFSNISSQSDAGALTAALFLRRFVPEDSRWNHIDMQSVMQSVERGHYSGGATGFGARLLADYSLAVSKNK